MANCVAEGAQAGGAEASVIPSSAFTANDMDTYDAVAFGCPSMGSEQLEESEFEPMFTDCEVKLSGKRIALFGSYGWGDGQWMRDWVQRTNDANAVIYTDEGLILNETPDDDGIAKCKEFGKGFAAF